MDSALIVLVGMVVFFVFAALLILMIPTQPDSTEDLDEEDDPRHIKDHDYPVWIREMDK